MPKPKVLYVCHNHPSVRPGGAEAYALELYHGVREHGAFEPFLVARAGPPMSDRTLSHPGTALTTIAGDPNQYFLYTGDRPFDYLNGTMTGKDFYTRVVANLLSALRPDIVHFQHTVHLGFDFIRQVRNTLPGVPI